MKFKPLLSDYERENGPANLCTAGVVYVVYAPPNMWCNRSSEGMLCSAVLIGKQAAQVVETGSIHAGLLNSTVQDTISSGTTMLRWQLRPCSRPAIASQDPFRPAEWYIQANQNGRGLALSDASKVNS